MSSEIVKKRGRSRKALASDEGVIVLDQAEIEKTKKAATKKRAAKNTQDSTQAKAGDISSQPSSATSDKETAPARSKNGRKPTTTKVDAAKNDSRPGALQDTTSPILSQADAFNTVSTGKPKSKPTREEPPTEVDTAGPNNTIKKGPKASTQEPAVGTPGPTNKPHDVVHEYTSTMPIGSLLNETRPPEPLAGAATLSTGVDDEKMPAPVVTRLPLDAPASSSKSPPQVGLNNTSPQAKLAADLSSASPSSGHPFPQMAHTNQAKPPAPTAASSQASRLTVWPPRPRAADQFASPELPVKQLRPTEMPYEVLKKDPKFKALSRKWTSLIVALPIAIVTSVVLFDRIVNKTPQKRVSDIPLDERRTGGATPKVLFEDRFQPPREKRLLEE